jgi:hypothetical protein
VKNKMSDLRNHLFETLEALKDEDRPMDLDRAKTVSLVAQTIINSATVEVKFMNANISSERREFFEDTPKTPQLESSITTMPRKQGAI